jgi:hypothetical protein
VWPNSTQYMIHTTEVHYTHTYTQSRERTRPCVWLSGGVCVHRMVIFHTRCIREVTLFLSHSAAMPPTNRYLLSSLLILCGLHLRPRYPTYSTITFCCAHSKKRGSECNRHETATGRSFVSCVCVHQFGMLFCFL